jgi:hypothetical protein
MDWSKVSEKALKGGVTGGLAVVAAQYIVSKLTNKMECDPLVLAFVAAQLTALAHGALNWLKHRGDPKVTKPEVAGPTTG